MDGGGEIERDEKLFQREVIRDITVEEIHNLESEREFRLNVNEKLQHIKVTSSLDEVLLDEDGNIVSFRYAELKTGEYTLEESIFKASAASLMTFKTEISNGKKSDYDNIREYNEGVLTHIETSEGTVNEIQIYSDIYASVFVYD